MKEFFCQHIGVIVILGPVCLYILYLAVKMHLEDHFDSMWDGKPWDEAEYQRKVKEWEKEREERNASR